MFSNVNDYVIEKIKSSKIENYPYPHIVVDNIFPTEYYNKIIENRISTDCLQTLKELKRVGAGYSDSRKVINLTSHMSILEEHIRPFWEDLAIWMNEILKKTILNKFLITEKNLNLDILYTRDSEFYSLGPHTDSTKKILTMLIYIPSDNKNSNLGTSIYLPKDEQFICEGGPHHKRELFNLYKTISYIPNRMFCFLKTNKSFHGVEPITQTIERDLIIYDIQRIK